MYKVIFILISILFLHANANEIIQASIKYNEASARIEAFKDVEQKINKEFYKDYLKDKNYKRNIESIKNNILRLETYSLCPFYLKKTLASYSITYDENPEYNFYYNILGSLVKFDITQNNSYPTRTLGYSRFGNLISVSFNVNENEQFIYDENGKLMTHWLDNTAYDKDNKLPKVFKLKRGIIEND